TNIGFDFIVATDVPQNEGTVTCLGCFLNFETGANTLTGPTNYAWAPGGTFTITGEVPGVTPPGSTVLLSGTFTLATAIGNNLPGNTQDFILFSGTGVDLKNSDLLAFFGLPADTLFQFGSTDISTTARINANGTFVGNVDEADVTNTGLQVPEPGSMMLLLLGLGSLAAYRRRRS
ncbi:MAG: PEP-CTERM sorting domain-containing protein, partial [Vicinamibacteria bacterium]